MADQQREGARIDADHIIVNRRLPKNQQVRGATLKRGPDVPAVDLAVALEDARTRLRDSLAYLRSLTPEEAKDTSGTLAIVWLSEDLAAVAGIELPPIP